MGVLADLLLLVGSRPTLSSSLDSGEPRCSSQTSRPWACPARTRAGRSASRVLLAEEQALPGRERADPPVHLTPDPEGFELHPTQGRTHMPDPKGNLKGEETSTLRDLERWDWD